MTVAKRFFSEQKTFLAVLTGAVALAAVVQGYPALAMWVGFIFAAYSVVANDSIQTIGTFLASNRDKPWWQVFLYLGGILVVTSGYSWYHYQGDVSFGRLASKGFEQAPESFLLLQLCAPLVLLLLTRLAIPVSTTFLILSCFATQASSIGKVMMKSVSGYGIAFVCSFLLWITLAPIFARFRDGKPAPGWAVGQWLTSGLLWSVWLMQDAANVAIYLPRGITAPGFLAYITILLAALALLIYRGGGGIQKVVTEKEEIADIRQATCIDLLYAGILYYFKILSSIPMSTTWVFIGLLGGRELGMSLQRRRQGKSWPQVRKMLALDLAKVTVGLVISLLLAVMVNPVVRQAVFGE
jgi:hypothetical protein